MRMLRTLVLLGAAGLGLSGCVVYPDGSAGPAYGPAYGAPPVYVAPPPVVIAPRPYYWGSGPYYRPYYRPHYRRW